MRIRTIMIFMGASLLVACGTSTDTADTPADTTTPAAVATAPPTTMAASTTTTVAPTTTTEAMVMALVVNPTPIVGVLEAYNPEGEALFPEESVEAHWYQWDGFYVVLYRGYDAASGAEICPGNSIMIPGVGFSHVSNAPHLGAADEICVGTATLATGAARACGSLLYYVTQIPTTAEGALFGTLEIGDATGFRGQTSEVIADLAATPDFEPGLEAYQLPGSGVDDLALVACG